MTLDYMTKSKQMIIIIFISKLHFKELILSGCQNYLNLINIGSSNGMDFKNVKIGA